MPQMAVTGSIAHRRRSTVAGSGGRRRPAWRTRSPSSPAAGSRRCRPRTIRPVSASTRSCTARASASGSSVRDADERLVPARPSTTTGNERSVAITRPTPRRRPARSDGRNTASGHRRARGPQRHARAHAERPRLVRRRGHDLARSGRVRRRRRPPPAARPAPGAAAPRPRPGTGRGRRAGPSHRSPTPLRESARRSVREEPAVGAGVAAGHARAR